MIRALLALVARIHHISVPAPVVDDVDLVPDDCLGCGYPLDYCACGYPYDRSDDADCDGCGGPISDPGLCEACVQNFNNDPAGDLSDYVEYLQVSR